MSIIIGSLPSLGAKPLTRWFSRTEEGQASQISIVYAEPPALTRMLGEGKITAALLSSFAYFQTPGYAFVPGISVSGQDTIESERAFARVPWRKIESLALDSSSLTSAALLQILLAESLESYPAFLQTAPDQQTMLASADACLLTGDAGLRANGDGLNILDLGHAWRRLTGLPFVYAAWLGRQEHLTPHLVETLASAKAWGLTQTEAIAKEEAQRLGVSVRRCRQYLTDVVEYDLGEEHLRALEAFGAKARAHRLLAAPPGPVRVV